jgi:hypothetical protein
LATLTVTRATEKNDSRLHLGARDACGSIARSCRHFSCSVVTNCKGNLCFFACSFRLPRPDELLLAPASGKCVRRDWDIDRSSRCRGLWRRHKTYQRKRFGEHAVGQPIEKLRHLLHCLRLDKSYGLLRIVQNKRRADGHECDDLSGAVRQSGDCGCVDSHVRHAKHAGCAGPGLGERHTRESVPAPGFRGGYD